MSDLARKIRDAAPLVDAPWSSAREEATRTAMHRRKQRRAQVARALFVVVGLMVLALIFGRHPAERAQSQAVAPRLEASASTSVALLAPLRLPDGSTIEPLRASTTVRPIASSDALAAFELADGRARFTVTPNPKRAFRVRAANVSVEVVGTIFVVDRASDAVTVSVERGHVRVTRDGEATVDLFAGDTRRVQSEIEATPMPSAPAAPSALPPTSLSAPAIAPTSAAWSSLARDGAYDEAYDALRKSGTSSVRDEPADLLLSADVARLSKHSAEAVAPLARIVEKFSSDSRAPLAAFTLGRVYLDEMSEPREAALAFAKTRVLAPDGALVEDALAREVEAWWRVGNTDLARARADEYVARFPAGSKLRSVRKFGGIE